MTSAGLSGVMGESFAMPGNTRWPKPFFSGKTLVPPRGDEELIFVYMTAEQMQAKIAGLTGYTHPAFIQYAAVLGHFDAKTGVRTADRPTLLSVLLLQRIGKDLAEVVIERETFLSPQERCVFNDVDLTVAPAEPALRSFLSSLYLVWLGQTVAETALKGLVERFFAVLQQEQKPTLAYQNTLAVLLQHGGLYYT